MKALQLYSIDLTAGTTATQEVAQLVPQFLPDCQALLLEELPLVVNCDSFEFLQGILCLQRCVCQTTAKTSHTLPQQSLAGHGIVTIQSALEVTRCSFTCAQPFRHLRTTPPNSHVATQPKVTTHTTHRTASSTQVQGWWQTQEAVQAAAADHETHQTLHHKQHVQQQHFGCALGAHSLHTCTPAMTCA